MKFGSHLNTLFTIVSCMSSTASGIGIVEPVTPSPTTNHPTPIPTNHPRPSPTTSIKCNKGTYYMEEGRQCKNVGDLCDVDCECCGYPGHHQNSIRCTTRNHIFGKRCYKALYLNEPCTDDSDCLSQNCALVDKEKKCMPAFHHNRTKNYCPIATSADIKEIVNGVRAKCSCDMLGQTPAHFMDGKLETAYENPNSQGFSGLVVEPRLKGPIRIMEVCSSQHDRASDPLCYRISGKCENDADYSLVHECELPFNATHQECQNITFKGRQSFTRYKVEFGCRRGGFNDNCPTNHPTSHPTKHPTFHPTNHPTPPFLGPPPGGSECDESKANCAEVTPKGKESSSICTPKFTEDGTDSFSDFEYEPTMFFYDEVNDISKHTFSFENKIGRGKNFPDLSHAVLQFNGGCCILDSSRVYRLEHGIEQQVDTFGAGDHIANPKPTVCMSGIDLPGVPEDLGKNVVFYYEVHIRGKFESTKMADYVLKGGQLVKYGTVLAPDCTCPERRAQLNHRLFRGLPQSLQSRRNLQLRRGLWPRRKAQQICFFQPVTISEVKFFGKCNEVDTVISV